jgi:hypothetical protein
MKVPAGYKGHEFVSRDACRAHQPQGKHHIMEKTRKISAQKRRQRMRADTHERLARLPVDFSVFDAWNACRMSWNFPGGYYENRPFLCKDCGKPEVWTAWQQKWWYEKMNGAPDSVAVRCHACRIEKRERKAEARRVSEEGMARKRARQAQNAS